LTTYLSEGAWASFHLILAMTITFETTGYLRVCHMTASVRLHPFYWLMRMSIWISAMMIHVSIGDWLPAGLPYDGQRFASTFFLREHWGWTPAHKNFMYS
jgi:hypothetical protein